MLAQLAQSCVVLIDIQQRLVAAMPDADAQQVTRQSGLLTQVATILGVPLMVSEQYPKGLGSTIASVQTYLPDTAVQFEKTCFSCTQLDAFMTQLRHCQKRQVFLAGIEAHICVLQTALSLHKEGFQVFVIEDAVCSRHSDNKRNALDRLRQAGVIVTNLESVIFEWLADAAHPQFKVISKLVVQR